MPDIIPIMSEEDARLLEGLVKALRNVSGSGGLDVRLVPGQGLMLAHGGRRSARVAPQAIAGGGGGAAAAFEFQSMDSLRYVIAHRIVRFHAPGEDPAYELERDGQGEPVVYRLHVPPGPIIDLEPGAIIYAAQLDVAQPLPVSQVFPTVHLSRWRLVVDLPPRFDVVAGMVLQTNEAGDLVWDYVRAVP